ncbi:hypothetical protein ACFYW8_13590 [Streptomyces sp. NPDC002742]|uniref:hypothetical protein n=1 Tax=Streptomyces sp. NPDC002742 TaxID=3364663 RepID=UPI0036A90678
MPGLRRTSVIAVAGGIMLLTGCQDSAGAGSAAGTRTSAPAASAPATSPSSGPVGTRTPSHGSATASATAERVTDKSPAPTSHPSTAVAGCRNLAVDDAVKAAVTQVYRHDVTHFTHIEPVPHVFFYGQCGTTRYAATRFGLTAGATQAELVGMQDEGSAVKYFRSSGGGWVYVASDGFPAGPHGCGDIPAIPHALATAWGNCSLPH